MHNRRTRANTPRIIPPTAAQIRQTTEGEMATTEGEIDMQAEEGEEATPPTWYETPRPPRATKNRRSNTHNTNDVPGDARAERARARAQRQEKDVRVARETTRQTPHTDTEVEILEEQD